MCAVPRDEYPFQFVEPAAPDPITAVGRIIQRFHQRWPRIAVDSIRDREGVHRYSDERLRLALSAEGHALAYHESREGYFGLSLLARPGGDGAHVTVELARTALPTDEIVEAFRTACLELPLSVSCSAMSSEYGAIVTSQFLPKTRSDGLPLLSRLHPRTKKPASPNHPTALAWINVWSEQVAALVNFPDAVACIELPFHPERLPDARWWFRVSSSPPTATADLQLLRRLYAAMPAIGYQNVRA